MHCDIPIWTAQAIMEYAAQSEEVLDRKIFTDSELFFDVVRLILSTTLVTRPLIMFGINLVQINSFQSIQSMV